MEEPMHVDLGPLFSPSWKVALALPRDTHDAHPSGRETTSSRGNTRASLSLSEGTTICPPSSHWGHDDQERRSGEDIVCVSQTNRHPPLLPSHSPFTNTLLSETVSTVDKERAPDPTLNPSDTTATSDRSRFRERPSALYIQSRPSPYSIRLPPLSSTRSTIEFNMDEEEDKKPTAEELEMGVEHKEPSTPIRGYSHRRNQSTTSNRSSGGGSITSSPLLGSPSGSMSLRARRKKSAPNFPASPRQDVDEPVSASHLNLLHRKQTTKSALISPVPRSAGGLPASAPLRTPALLRVTSSPFSPAFYQTGYSHPMRGRGSQPRVIVRTPQSPYFHRGGLAPRTPVSASAPARTPVKLEFKGRGGLLPEQGELDKVSKAWVVKALQKNAPNVWYSPETTDCRVVVPVWSKLAARKKARAEAARRVTASNANVDDSAIEVDTPITDKQPTATPATADSIHSNQPGKTYWPPTPANVAQVNASADGMAKGKEDVVSSQTIKRGRRGSLPGDDTIPVIVFPLHKDYLITQSKLFRRLFSSASSQLDPAVNGLTGRGVSDGEDALSAPETKFKGAKVLPTPRGEPEAVYIPMPDPAAFGVVVQWLYWGDPKAVEMALSRGIISWEGLVYNIDYLDLEDDIKRIVGTWWRKWVKTESSSGSRNGGTEFEDDDDEEERKGGGSGMEADEEDELKDDVEDEAVVKQEPMDDRFMDGFRRL